MGRQQLQFGWCHRKDKAILLAEAGQVSPILDQVCQSWIIVSFGEVVFGPSVQIKADLALHYAANLKSPEQ